MAPSKIVSQAKFNSANKENVTAQQLNTVLRMNFQISETLRAMHSSQIVGLLSNWPGNFILRLIIFSIWSMNLCKKTGNQWSSVALLSRSNLANHHKDPELTRE